MTTYNGWTNYATWRVNLEVFDGLSPEDIGCTSEDDAYELSMVIKAYAEDAIIADTQEGLARDYSLAFLSQVDWREIAEHVLEAYADN